MARRKKSKSAAYKKQYAEMIENAHMIFNDLQLGLKLGEKTPTFQRVLKEAGTRSGLKAPTKKSIQALKRLQTESGVLRQVYWSMPKGPERDRAKELFEKAYEEEKRVKDLDRAARKLQKGIDKLKEELNNSELSQEQKQKINRTINDIEQAKEEMIQAKTYRFILEVRKQCERAIEPFITQRIMTAWEKNVVSKGTRIISLINDILTGASPDEMAQFEENAQDIISQFGTIEAEDLYMFGDDILNHLKLTAMEKLEEKTRSNTSDFTDNQKAIFNEGTDTIRNVKNNAKGPYNWDDEFTGGGSDIWDQLE